MLAAGGADLGCVGRKLPDEGRAAAQDVRGADERGAHCPGALALLGRALRVRAAGHAQAGRQGRVEALHRHHVLWHSLLRARKSCQRITTALHLLAEAMATTLQLLSMLLARTPSAMPGRPCFPHGSHA